LPSLLFHWLRLSRVLTVEKSARVAVACMPRRGRAIGQRIGAGPVRVLDSIDQMHEFSPGEVLVADTTDPDWEPIMKRAAAIVTNRGGRTCQAAIIARELGIPAVVGTGRATRNSRRCMTSFVTRKGVCW
jgi:pyruvate,water dikinase